MLLDFGIEELSDLQLDEMEIGDVFYIHVLDRPLAYQVDQIETTVPEDLALLAVALALRGRRKTRK